MKDLMQKQPMMRKVVYSLLPLWAFSIFLYGWRALVIPAVVFPAAIFSEWLIEKVKKKKTTKVSEAVLVTSALYSLAMPPELANPGNLWIVAIGIIFAVIIGKGVYGGFGKNIFNPAITGRLFIYLAFPQALGTGWTTPGLFGITPAGMDAVTGATVMDVLKDPALSFAGEGLNVFQNIFGTAIPEWLGPFLGFQNGSMGETSFILIVLAGLYLSFAKVGSVKVARWQLMVATAGSAFLLMAGLYYIPELLGFSAIPRAINPFMGIMSGSIAFVAVFMSTDPVSGPKNTKSMWVYGTIIGVVTVLIRTFAGFPEGTSFAILVGNTFASLLDETLGSKKKAKVKAPPKPQATAPQEAKA